MHTQCKHFPNILQCCYHAEMTELWVMHVGCSCEKCSGRIWTRPQSYIYLKHLSLAAHQFPILALSKLAALRKVTVGKCHGGNVGKEVKKRWMMAEAQR